MKAGFWLAEKNLRGGYKEGGGENTGQISIINSAKETTHEEVKQKEYMDKSDIINLTWITSTLPILTTIRS